MGPRLRLQKIIDRLRDEAETVPGGHLRKLKKELKDIIRTNGRLEFKDQIEKKNEKIEKARQKYAQEMDPALIIEQEREYEELERIIEKLIEGLGLAEEMEAILDQKKKECKDMEMKNANSDLRGIQPDWERDSAIFRKEYKELKDKSDQLHSANYRLLEKIEKVNDLKFK